jgi:universal stress protein E
MRTSENGTGLKSIMNNAYKKILLVTDGSPSAKSAEQSALKLAVRDHAEVLIVDTIRMQGRVEKWLVKNSEEMYASLEKEKQAYLEETAAAFKAKGVKKANAKLLHGRSSQQLTAEVIRSECDLLVRYRKGIDSNQSGLLGRTSVNLLRICPCPVLLVKEGHPINDPKVLACVDIHDPEPVNDGIIAAAKKIKGATDANIGLLYCWYMFGHRMMRRRMSHEKFEALFEDIQSENEREFDRFLKRYGLDHSSPGIAFEFGDAEYTIVPHVMRHSVDVTVMSTIAPTKTVSRLLGSTIESVISELPTNLLAVKPPGFVSPVKLESATGEIIETENVEYSMPRVI